MSADNTAAAAKYKRLPRPAQLQIKQSGAWRSALNFDAGEAPPEFLEAADSLGRLSGTHVGMRIVICIPSGGGSTIPTRNVLMNWTRETGWVSV